MDSAHTMCATVHLNILCRLSNTPLYMLATALIDPKISQKTYGIYLQ